MIRALQRQGLADVYGETDIPIYCLNVAYPLIPNELVQFCAGKEQVLVLEEGQPEYIEQGIQTVLRRQDVQTRVYGKDIMPMAGEYTGQVMLEGITRFIRRHRGRHPSEAVAWRRCWAQRRRCQMRTSVD